MIRNGRVVLAGLLLLVASGLLAMSAARPELAVPVVAGAGAMIAIAVVTLVHRHDRHPRPA